MPCGWKVGGAFIAVWEDSHSDADRFIVSRAWTCQGFQVQDDREPLATVEIAAKKFLAILVDVSVRQRTVQEKLDLQIGHHELEVG